MNAEPLKPITICANGGHYDVLVGEARDTNVPGIKAIPYYLHGQFAGWGLEGIPTSAGEYTLRVE